MGRIEIHMRRVRTDRQQQAGVSLGLSLLFLLSAFSTTAFAQSRSACLRAYLRRYQCDPANQNSYPIWIGENVDNRRHPDAARQQLGDWLRRFGLPVCAAGLDLGNFLGAHRMRFHRPSTRAGQRAETPVPEPSRPATRNPTVPRLPPAPATPTTVSAESAWSIARLARTTPMPTAKARLGYRATRLRPAVQVRALPVSKCALIRKVSCANREIARDSGSVRGHGTRFRQTRDRGLLPRSSKSPTIPALTAAKAPRLTM